MYMVFNGNSDGQDLCTLANEYANTTTLTYPLARKARSANKWMRLIWSWIFDSYGGWQYDDANNTDLPIGTTSLTANQADYDIPPGSLTVRGIEIMPSATSTVYLRPVAITEEQLTEKGITEISFFTATGVPLFYRVIGSSIKLYPTPSYTATNGLRVTFDRGSTAFASTATVQQPGFASEFHEAVAVGMAAEYCRQNHLSYLPDLNADLAVYERNIKKYYSSRYQEKYPGRLNVFDATREYL